MAVSDATVRTMVLLIEPHVSRITLRRIIDDLGGASTNAGYLGALRKVRAELKLDRPDSIPEIIP